MFDPTPRERAVEEFCEALLETADMDDAQLARHVLDRLLPILFAPTTAAFTAFNIAYGHGETWVHKAHDGVDAAFAAQREEFEG